MKNRISILCIDDDVQIRFALSALCESQGWQPYVAGNVSEALQMFDREPVDLIVIDYHLPGINGIEGVRLFRNRSRQVPIIVFTIDDNQEVADAFLHAGASDFALKPIKAPDMISRLKLHIRLMEKERGRELADARDQEGREGRADRKGISCATTELILEYLSRADGPMTAPEIAAGTGLANQTAYRYLQYLVEDGRIKSDASYGKVGRPKQSFSLPAERKLRHFLKRFEQATDPESRVMSLYNGIGVWVGFNKVEEFLKERVATVAADRLLKAVSSVRSEGDSDTYAGSARMSEEDLSVIADCLRRELSGKSIS